jgi:phosphotransferase system  glucose/maltose/N-acetylglucosamine-specific IIC component
MKIAALILIVAFVIVITRHEALRLIDDRTENYTDEDIKLKKEWHRWKGAFQILVAVLISLYFGVFAGILFAALFTIVHDAYVNKEVLDKPLDYVGQTAWLDIRLKKLFKTDRKVLIAKVVVLIISALLFAVL